MKKLILTLTLLMSVICGAMAQNDAMYIYRNDGEFNAFLKTDIDSMRYSHLDAEGVYHNDWQMQEIFTPDSTYCIPLASIDSISFVTPPVEYKSNVQAIDDNLLNYLVAHTDSTLTFSSDVPLQLLPDAGEVLVFDKYEEPIPEGFYGRLVSREQTAEGWLCSFEGVGFEDLYSHLVIVGKVDSYNDDEEANSRRRIFAIGKNKSIPLPSKLPLFLSIKDIVNAHNIFGSKQRKAPEVDGRVGVTLKNPQLTLDYIVCVGEPNLRDCVKLVANLRSDGVAEVSGSCSGSYSPEPHWFPGCQRPFNFYGVAGELDFGLYFEANGEVNAKYTVPIAFNATRGFIYNEGEGFGSLEKEQSKDFFNIYQDKAEWDLNLNGSLYFGFAGMLSVGLVNKKVASLDLTLKVGPEVSGNFKVADNENGFNTNLYDILKNAEVTQSLRVQLDPGYRVWFSERESFGHPLTGNFFETTRPLLPSFDNLKWTPQGNNAGKLTADVERDVFVPVKLGWTLLDKDDEVYKKEYFSENYLLNENWSKPTLPLSISNLPSNYDYKAYPTIKLWNWEIPINEYAEVKKKECPAHITDFKQTGSYYSKGGYNNDGRTYDYKYEVATTVEIESLDGISEWGYVYKDPYGNVKRIPLTEYGTSHTDTRYAYYRNEAKSAACLYGYVQYEGDDEYYDGEPHDYPLEYAVHSCPDSNHPHAIDLGLPSGTKWCCMNVGASSPEQPGGYYAWGETSEKSVYNEVTYAYFTGQDTDGDGWIEKNFSVINIGSDIAGTSYDVAHVKMGGAWRMPSSEQQRELVNNCSRKWTQQNGVNGILVTGKNGGQLFLPAAGHRDGSGLDYAGSYGCYWLSSLDSSLPYYAFVLGFGSGDVDWYRNDRRCGQSVRPVCP